VHFPQGHAILDETLPFLDKLCGIHLQIWQKQEIVMYNLFEAGNALNTPFECFIYSDEKNRFPVRPHWHYFAELIFMLEGCAEMHADEHIHTAHVGDMIFFHPQSVHSIYAAAPGPLRYIVLKFDINSINIASSYAPKLRSIVKSARNKQMPFYFPAEEAEKIECRRLFENCVDELQRQEYGYDRIIQTKLYHLLMNIIRCWMREGFSIDHDVFSADAQYDIDSVTEYIDSHIKENLPVADIAAKCGLSYSCFAKKFHQLYGKSCKTYIEEMKIFKVEDFLLFTDFDLTYISQETGFSDCSHMIKCFKKYRDCTPKQFRTKHKPT